MPARSAGDVGTDRDGPGSDVGYRRVQCGSVTAHDEDGGALLRETPRHGETDAAGTSGDERGAVRETSHVRPPGVGVDRRLRH